MVNERKISSIHPKRELSGEQREQMEIGDRFRDIVRRTVDEAQNARGLTREGTNWFNAMRHQHFAGFDVESHIINSQYDGPERNFADLGFIPSHAVIIKDTSIEEEFPGNMMTFGLQSNGAIVRNYQFALGNSYNRELDPEEAAALVAYIEDPKKSDEQRKIAMRLNDEEKQAFDEDNTIATQVIATVTTLSTWQKK